MPWRKDNRSPSQVTRDSGGGSPKPVVKRTSASRKHHLNAHFIVGQCVREIEHEHATLDAALGVLAKQ
jgi:hypothetical protein